MDVHLLPGELPPPGHRSVRPARVAQTVAVARRILEAEGPDALTMRRLADELGIRAPSLYKHFASKAAVESAIIEDVLFDIGEATHEALRSSVTTSPLLGLLTTYRTFSVAHPDLYRLATGGRLARQSLPPGLEEWAGNPWFVVTGDPSLAQALWSFAHGMVILELDDRYPPGSALDDTWRAGADAFERSAGPLTAGPLTAGP